jgi:hypothetical protein
MNNPAARCRRDALRYERNLMMMTYEEAVSHYFNSVADANALPQPSECLSVLHDDDCWCLANVNGALALVDDGGSVLRVDRE